MVLEHVRAVTFDVYGTLFDVSGLASALEDRVPNAGDVVRTWRTKQLEYSFVRSMTHAYEDFQTVTSDALDYAIEAHGLEVSETERGEWMALWGKLPIFDDVVPLLDSIASHQRVVLSNGTETMVTDLLRHAGLEQRVDLVLSADSVRRFKPDPSVYALVPASLGVPKGEILFVTANGFDIAGARKFGFVVCRANRTAAPEDRTGWTSHLTVTDFAELQAMLVQSA